MFFFSYFIKILLWSSSNMQIFSLQFHKTTQAALLIAPHCSLLNFVPLSRNCRCKVFFFFFCSLCLARVYWTAPRWNTVTNYRKFSCKIMSNEVKLKINAAKASRARFFCLHQTCTFFLRWNFYTSIHIYSLNKVLSACIIH